MTIKTAFDKNISTSESEANSALMELDRGLRSLQNGEQCEAIIKFLQFFDKYPLPIFINSAFLKLTDVYREGSNFMRNLIYIVFQQSQKHIDKILNIDELLKRIFVLSHSNDPIARSITLRLLGSISGIVPDRTNVHHFIQNSLESHDKIEVESALFAAGKFCEKSNIFSTSICNKIEAMLENLSIPLDIKIKIIPLLQYMYRDINLYEKAKKICYSLLDSHPTQEFTIVSLNTLTKLTLNAKVDIINLMNLLLTYADDDLRLAVKITCVKDFLLIINGDQDKYKTIDMVNEFKDEDGNLVKMDEFTKHKIGEINLIEKQRSYTAITNEHLSVEVLSKILLIFKNSCDALLFEFNLLPNSLITLLGCHLKLIYSILLKHNEPNFGDVKLKNLLIIMFEKLSTITKLEMTKNVMRKYLAKLYLSKLIVKLCTQLYIGSCTKSSTTSIETDYWLFTSLENLLEDSFCLLDYINSRHKDVATFENKCDKYNCRQSGFLKYQLGIYKIIQSTILNVCQCFETICTLQNIGKVDESAQTIFPQILFTYIQRAFTSFNTVKAKHLLEPCKKVVQIILILTASFSKLYKSSNIKDGSNSYYMKSLVELWEKSLLAEKTSSEFEERAKLDSTVIVALSKLIFDMKAHCDGTLMLKVNSYNSNPSNYWTLYLIAGQAMRRSHHHCAQIILATLTNKALTPHNFYWLNALYHVAASEAELNPLSDLDNSQFLFKAYPKLEKCVELHRDALDYLQTASKNFPHTLGYNDYTLPLAFQLKFTDLRVRTLKLYLEMCGTIISFYLNPIDVFEMNSFTMVPHENFIHKIKVGKYRHRMSGHEADLGQLVRDYEVFSRTQCFDCDPVSGQIITRETVERLKILWEALIKTFDFQHQEQYGRPFDQNSIGDVVSDNNTKILYEDWLSSWSNNSFAKLKERYGEFWGPFYELFVGLLKLPNPYPSFYFNSAQNTVIKLAITPQPKYHGGSSVNNQGTHTSFNAVDTTTYVTCNFGSLLNVNVEGLTLHLGRKREIFRTVSRLLIHCTYSPLMAHGGYTNGIGQDVTALYAQIPYMQKAIANCTSTKEVVPKNDYFSCQFLLEFPSPGFYAITIKCEIIDNDDQHWETGLESTLNVKAS